MLDFARGIIGTQPILTAFLAIGLGYLVGQISIGGFSLGVGAVLFVGLALGAFAPKVQIIGPIGLIGLIMFLYGVGILYGRQFFEGMMGVAGRKYNLLALIAVAAGLAVALGLGHVFGVGIGHTLGIFAGSMTSTATLQAALDTMRNSEPSIGYSVAYPFGVIGPILCMYFMTRMLRPKFPPKAPQMHMGEITLGPTFAGQPLHELNKDLPNGLQVTMIRKGEKNYLPITALLLERGNSLLVVAERQSDIAVAAERLGSLEPGQIVKDRSTLDYIRVFVGKARSCRRAIGEAASAVGVSCAIAAHQALRRRSGPCAGFDSRVRRSGRRPDASGSKGRSPALLRGYCQIGGRVQLCLTWDRDGTRRTAWPYSHSNSGCRNRNARDRWWSADRCSHCRQTSPHRAVALGHAAAGEYRAPQLRTCAVPGDGRSQCRAAVFENHHRDWIHALLDRRCGTAGNGSHRITCRVLRFENRL